MSELLNSAAPFWGGIVAVLSVVSAAGLKCIDFYENYLVPRILNRYDRLSDSLENDSKLKAALELAKEEEAFRLLFRHGGTPRYQTALRMLYESGEYSLKELQSCRTYLRVENVPRTKKELPHEMLNDRSGESFRITAKFGGFEHIAMWLLSSLLVLFVMYFAIYIGLLIAQNTLAAWTVIVISLSVFLVIFLALGSEVLRWLLVIEFQRKFS